VGGGFERGWLCSDGMGGGLDETVGMCSAARVCQRWVFYLLLSIYRWGRLSGMDGYSREMVRVGGMSVGDG
jgi:hypothetical protein